MYIVTFIDAVSINNAGLFYIPKYDYIFWMLGTKQNVGDTPTIAVQTLR